LDITDPASQGVFFLILSYLNTSFNTEYSA